MKNVQVFSSEHKQSFVPTWWFFSAFIHIYLDDEHKDRYL